MLIHLPRVTVCSCTPAGVVTEWPTIRLDAGEDVNCYVCGEYIIFYGHLLPLAAWHFKNNLVTIWQYKGPLDGVRGASIRILIIADHREEPSLCI